MLKEKVKKLYKQVQDLKYIGEKERRRMPSECFFLDDGAILCYPREIGDGRYPYQTDGLTLWAYSSGNMEVGESLYNVFLSRVTAKTVVNSEAKRGDSEGEGNIAVCRA